LTHYDVAITRIGYTNLSVCDTESSILTYIAVKTARTPRPIKVSYTQRDRSRDETFKGGVYVCMYIR